MSVEVLKLLPKCSLTLHSLWKYEKRQKPNICLFLKLFREMLFLLEVVLEGLTCYKDTTKDLGLNEKNIQISRYCGGFAFLKFEPANTKKQQLRPKLCFSLVVSGLLLVSSLQIVKTTNTNLE